MPGSVRSTRVLAWLAAASGAGLLLGLAGWPQRERVVELCALLVAAILVSIHEPDVTADEQPAMRLSFVVAFFSLLLFGPLAAMLVASVAAAARAFAEPQGPQPRTLVTGTSAVVATSAAAFAYSLLGGTTGRFVWPWQALPTAVGALAYCAVNSGSAAIANLAVARQPIDRAWSQRLLRSGPTYIIGATVAAALVELVDHRLWKVLPVVAVPLYFAHRAYVEHLARTDDEPSGREVVDLPDQGMCVVDGSGLITLWNDTLERTVGCPRERAMGRSLVSAVPDLRATALPQSVGDTLKDGRSRTLAQVELPAASGRVLQVNIVPVAGGASLVWHDVTERARAEHELRQSEERLALAAEGANDGLWAWDLRSQEFFFSARLNAMIGLPGPARVGRPEEWINRVHPEDVAGLKEAVEAHLSGKTEYFEHEHRVRHEDGSHRRFLCRGVAARNGARRAARIAGSLTDTTERTMAQEQLRSAGFVDPLTGLCNRAVFVEGLGRRLEEVKQRRGDRFAVLYLDLDGFKVVNDSLGHLVGDELLIAVSRRLEACVRPGDVLARLGGDEFAILLNGLVDEQQANAVAFRIQESLSTPFSIGGREVFMSASIGIAPGLTHYASPDEIMRDADAAMYHAKGRGRGRHEIFDADMHARARDRLGLENDLRHAVSANDFEVQYQPIVSLASGMCVGFESLVRWKRNGEVISPATFIPVAEEIGVIEPLGTWVLQEACRTFADWQRRFPASGLECITVNVSSRQLMQHNFLHIVEQAVRKARLKPCDLRIEITETALMASPHVAAEVLRDLRDFGVKIYLDDFGTGYSSLSHLHKLPVDALKIDHSFVKSLLLPDRPAIVESILALARTLNTSVVAEGIESDVQARELERLGCTHAQGYLFSRPLSTGSVEEMLAANLPLGRPQAPPAASPGPDEPYYSSVPFEWPDNLPV